MFIRKKKNRSGTTSIVVVRKIHGRFEEIKTIGVSKDNIQIEHLYKQAQEWIEIQSGTQDIFKQKAKEQEEKQVT